MVLHEGSKQIVLSWVEVEKPHSSIASFFFATPGVAKSEIISRGARAGLRSSFVPVTPQGWEGRRKLTTPCRVRWSSLSFTLTGSFCAFFPPCSSVLFVVPLIHRICGRLLVAVADCCSVRGHQPRRRDALTLFLAGKSNASEIGLHRCH